ncbi:hypothetical protein ACVWZ6_008055 [Bradyrhizobium sp. GM6.1]
MKVDHASHRIHHLTGAHEETPRAKQQIEGARCRSSTFSSSRLLLQRVSNNTRNEAA